jgi:hypothetical protein
MNDPTPPAGAETTGSPQTSSALVSAGDTLQVFSGIAAFDAAQRMARALCSSSLVPREYQGQQGLANSLIALEIAGRMRLSPLVVMQNMTPIHGRPTWSSKFLIATVNASGRFSPLRFVFDDKEKPTRCTAVATDKATGEVLEGETITLELARREGWWSRKDRQGNETSKWQTMTGQMLRYGAAAWWANVYCPEIALGLMTQEEALDIEPVSVRDAGGTSDAGAAVPAALAVLPQIEESAADAASPAPATPAAARSGSAARPAAVPKLLRTREDEAVVEEARNELVGIADSVPAQGCDESAEVMDAEIVAESSPPAPEPMAAAVSPSATPMTADELMTGIAPEAAAPSATPTPRRTRNQSAPAAAAAPAPPPPTDLSGTASPSVDSASASEKHPNQASPTDNSDPVALGLRQIPRITTLLELDTAYGRVNQLLSAGRINDENAERLWSAIARRRHQLEDAETAATHVPEAGA